MAESGGISGVGVAAVFAGGLLVWSGMKGYRVSALTRDIISGKNPSGLQTELPVSIGGLISGLLPWHFGGGSGTPSPGGNVTPSGGQPAQSNKANQALGQRMAASAGWTGAEWTALNNLIMGESGWSSTIKNPTSSASGIAQNINGFGPGYQYGNAPQQIAWLIHYIKTRYGDPINAWNQWQARSPHWY